MAAWTTTEAFKTACVERVVLLQFCHIQIYPLLHDDASKYLLHTNSKLNTIIIVVQCIEDSENMSDCHTKDVIKWYECFPCLELNI